MLQAGLKVNKLSAVDGRSLSNEELKAVSTPMAMLLQPRGETSPLIRMFTLSLLMLGVIGCFLSHRKFWQRVVDLNLHSAIVFEDDIQLVEDFKTKLILNMQRLRQDNITYDVLLLGAIGKVNYFGKDGIGPRLFSGYIGGSKKLKQLADYIYIPSRPAGTHAYMISNQGTQWNKSNLL